MTTNHISTTRSSATRPAAAGAGVAARPFPVLALLAGAGVALGGLLLLSAVAVVGWFLADAGAHGDTRDAVRVAADAWLTGHGSQLTLGGVTYGVVPLGLTVLLALGLWRGARWAVGVSEPEDDREAAYGVGLLVLAYLIVSVGAAVLAGDDAASPSLLRTVVGALVLSGAVGGATVLGSTGRWSMLTYRLPGDPAEVVRVLACALRIVTTVLAAGALTVLVSLGLHAGSVSAVLTAQDLSVGDLLMIALVSLVALPNAALLAVGYLAGPGFAVGTGTTVSTGSVLLGPVPAFPLLGALPGSGPTPWWTDLLLAVPPLLAVAAMVRRQRREPEGDRVDWRHGLAAGLLAGLVLGLLTGLGGGALGDGRMSRVGTEPLLVTLFLVLSLGAGGLLGGALAPLLARAADVVRLPAPSPLPQREAEPEEPQAAISPALAARLRAARLARTDEAERPASRPPFAPAPSDSGQDDEETVNLADEEDTVAQAWPPGPGESLEPRAAAGAPGRGSRPR